MAASDVTFQDGDLKHPYLVALVRWCVSSFWTTATVILHRLLTAPLPPNTVSKAPKPRPASSDHLHPEPLVECEVLHTPEHPTIDVIFVHGLYGSLANTWRQGEWMTKYDKKPTKVPLRRPHAIPTCKCTDESENCSDSNQKSDQQVKSERANEERDSKDMYKDIKLLPQNNLFTNFCNNTLLNQNDYSSNLTISDEHKSDEEVIIGENEEGDSEDLYKDLKLLPQNVFTDIYNSTLLKSEQKVISNDEVFITEKFYTETLLDEEKFDNYESQAQFVQDLYKSDISDEVNSNVKCDCVDCKGCGCICDACYSPCWPRDWVKVDYPGARVISINYTSDPHLWRPLWVKESKRLRLHERAEQMMSQLLDLGVGDRPIIWVGHSKGGLFIKQMYCEAYESHLKTTKDEEKHENNQNTTECNNDNRINHCLDNQTDNCDTVCDINDNRVNLINNVNDRSENNINGINDRLENSEISDLVNNNSDIEVEVPSKIDEEHRRSKLWEKSAGFMFYSVPHRGSPLADIKTPITARSIELMEICKDCTLVLSLQERWLRAASPTTPVRSLVETCRTLMSVLYLRIVSVYSADPDIGALYGVNVDHREICKPSSRHCLLYQELMILMKEALSKYKL